MKKAIAFIFLIPAVFFAQELNAIVTVNFDKLASEDKDRLQNFQQQVQDYLNNTKFTQQNWEGDKIDCSFNVFFVSSDGQTRYSAQVVITSQRPIEGTQKNSLMLSILDNSWSFQYEKNQSMYFNHTDFDPLLSFLDYYAYIIIGFDMDSYYPLGGTDYFNKALDITIRGSSSSYSDGWQLNSASFNRRALVENLLNAKYQQFRQDFFDYHYNGLDLLNNKSTHQQAVENIIKLITDLASVRDKLDSRSVLLKVFFDAKAGEIVEYLKDYSDKSIFETLKKIDPPHISKYDEALKVN
ncbi:DUF4835 family protein [Melioribacteraceae bacterium 4301-Me]|uniref:type IX secretion system protein PorD n=1 Tax=Pyranulibacter aquaticus TaxID=3163344 RepID=UPI003596CCB1